MHESLWVELKILRFIFFKNDHFWQNFSRLAKILVQFWKFFRNLKSFDFFNKSTQRKIGTKIVLLGNVDSSKYLVNSVLQKVSDLVHLVKSEDWSM